jgi:hypothetical protein
MSAPELILESLRAQLQEEKQRSEARRLEVT